MALPGVDYGPEEGKRSRTDALLDMWSLGPTLIRVQNLDSEDGMLLPSIFHVSAVRIFHLTSSG